MIESEPDSELDPEPESKPDPPIGLKLDSLDDLRRIVIMAKGGDPEAQHTLNAFLKFNSNIERTNLPKREDVQRMVYADYAGKTLYPDTDEDPFSKFADTMATAFMAKGGDKSKQFVELMKQTPSLSDLQTLQEKPRGMMDRILGRGKPE